MNYHGFAGQLKVRSSAAIVSTQSATPLARATCSASMDSTEYELTNEVYNCEIVQDEIAI